MFKKKVESPESPGDLESLHFVKYGGVFSYSELSFYYTPPIRIALADRATMTYRGRMKQMSVDQ
ncbi:MAG: hypothetical protein IIB57_01340 [Planctomycetes bacterium]|nr:hypothetical protein [Planctomycetota bacterium]